jgi:hypothetical protein
VGDATTRSASYLGDYDRADAAQDAAQRLYPRPAQVELMRALCLVRTGDAAVGVAHARDTVASLPLDHRDRAVIDLGQKVLDALPAGQRQEDDAMELWGLVGGGR